MRDTRIRPHGELNPHRSSRSGAVRCVTECL